MLCYKRWVYMDLMSFEVNVYRIGEEQAVG